MELASDIADLLGLCHTIISASAADEEGRKWIVQFEILNHRLLIDVCVAVKASMRAAIIGANIIS